MLFENQEMDPAISWFSWGSCPYCSVLEILHRPAKKPFPSVLAQVPARQRYGDLWPG